MSITEEVQARVEAAIQRMQKESDLFFLYGIEPEPSITPKRKYITYGDMVKK